MADKKVVVKVDGDSTGAEQAIQQTTKSLETLRRESEKKVGKIAAFEQATTDLGTMQAALDETRRKLAYFKEQARLNGDTGAKAFAADIRAAEREIDRLNTGIAKQRTQIGQLSVGLGKAGVDTRNLAAEKARLSASVANAERGIINLKGKLLEEQAAAKAAADRTRDAGAAAEKAGGQAQTGAGGMGKMATAMKAVAAAAVVREFVQANASLESIEKSLEAVTGSSESAKREMAFVRGEASRLGVDTAAAASSFLTLAAATKGTNLEGQKTREIWASVAGKMTALGATSADVSGAMIQLAQGASKGKFELEDLKSIAERIPGFFSTFAKAIGVTNEQFFDMVSNGQITADLLPKLADALGGSGGEINTFNANLGRMKNAWNDVLVAIGDTGAFDAISWVLAKTANVTSLVTLGWQGLAQKFKGDEAGLDETRKKIEEVSSRLLGVADAASSAAAGIAGLGQQAATTSANIERDIGNKIAGSMLKLDASIKTTADAFKTLGVDPVEIQTGISQAERSVIESFKRIAADPAVDGQVLLGSLLTALGKVSQDAVPELGFAFKAAANAGRQSADELAAGIDALASKTAGLWDKTDTLGEAYKRLGITSQAELKQTASEMEEAYKTLVKMKAPLVDLDAAWSKYAQAAIAANGGVADATLKAEAAQHGYAVEVDKSGKAHLKSLKEIKSETEAQASAQDRLTESVRETGEAAQASVEGVAEGAGQAAQQVVYLGHALEAGFRSFSKEAGDYYKGLHDLSIRHAATWDAVWLAIGSAAERTQRAMKEAQDWHAATLAGLKDGKTISDGMYESALRGLDTYKILGEQRLDTLRGALDSAKQKSDSLRDSARDTLSSIRDELDDLNKNYDEIERRRAAARKADLEAQIAAANTAGDAGAVADLQKALRLLNEVSAIRLRDAQAREAEAKADKVAAAPAPAKTIAVDLTANGRTVSLTAPAGQEDALLNLFKSLRNDMTRSH